jgi:hypothetical protein
MNRVLFPYTVYFIDDATDDTIHDDTTVDNPRSRYHTSEC